MDINVLTILLNMRQSLSESNLNGGLPNVVVSGSVASKTQTFVTHENQSGIGHQYTL